MQRLMRSLKILKSATKKGDLAALRIFKFQSVGQLFLQGYTLDEGVCLVYLEAIGPHEKFYRDLKNNWKLAPDHTSASGSISASICLDFSRSVTLRS